MRDQIPDSNLLHAEKERAFLCLVLMEIAITTENREMFVHLMGIRDAYLRSVSVPFESSAKINCNAWYYHTLEMVRRTKWMKEILKNFS